MKYTSIVTASTNIFTRIVEMVYALAERNKGQIIVIANITAAVPGMSMPTLNAQ